MEKLETGKHSCSGVEVQRSKLTTIKDVPYDCMELITERLGLLDHYKGWDCLKKPLLINGESPFHKHWFLQKSEVFFSVSDMNDIRSLPEADDLDYVRSSEAASPDLPISSSYCGLLFLDPVLGKEQQMFVNLDKKIPHRDPIICLPKRVHRRYYGLFAADKGLLVLNLHNDVRSKTGNRHDRFVVLNPVNNSMSDLPQIPGPLCSCKLLDCKCEAVPLKLTVHKAQIDGSKTTLSSSYKAYILESKYLPRPLRLNCKDTSRNYRVVVYDSVTKLWERTGAEWIGKSSNAQIFPMRNRVFHVSTGRCRGHFRDSFHDILYKFQDGILVGKVKAPCKVEPEDRYCNSDDVGDSCTYSCGCISTTVFEEGGRIFFFEQTSWVGSYGPNCISARIWELNDREMIWHQLYELSPHRLELYPKRQTDLFSESIIFTCEGILLVGHFHLDSNDYHGVAAFDISQKQWCKVPIGILENLQLQTVGRPCGFERFGGGAVDLDRIVFQPNARTIA